MPDDVTVDIIGLDEAIKKLEKLGKMNTLHAAIRAEGERISGLMTVYPASTAANVPAGPGSSWYKRGTGSFYWRIKDNAQVSYGKKSEVLKTSWASKYNNLKFEAKIGTDTSYAKYVQGTKSTQAKALKNIGWKGIDVVAKKETKKVGEMVFRAVKRAIDQA